ncbi:hypothetical protein LCM20_06290 [Halobacillus litoralis]|uniref:hypothetical protein n=1 Tax=Halobacillus litoralis TaxID=45668 RepID=UPI001CD26AAB|nr:hypothetical protein [Halobacillus litoralis]MCA0970189.1 hypothetical protein [Halobacillus litoralis]
MTFTATPYKLSFTMMSIVLLFSLILSPNWWYAVAIAVVVYSIPTTFELRIEDEHLEYQVKLMGGITFTKVLHPSDIRVMKFELRGFAWRFIKIKQNKGLPIRIYQFKPENIDRYLLDFAKQHDIEVDRTKGYGSVSLD